MISDVRLEVLVVEDDSLKFETIKNFLLERFPLLNIRREESVSATVSALKSKRFDLLLLDLMIPISSYGGVSKLGGVTVLEKIDNDPNLLAPSYIVGLSSFRELALEQRRNFEAKTWCLLDFDHLCKDWMDQLEQLILHIQNTKAVEVNREFLNDVLFVTALRDPEYQAVLNLPIAWDSRLFPVGENDFYKKGTVNCENTEVKIVASCIGRMGLVPAALLVDRLVSVLRPKLVVMCGICMGMPNETSLGDLVVASRSWNWQSGKFTRSEAAELEFQIQPEPVLASEKLTNLWSELPKGWIDTLHYGFRGKRPEEPPFTHIAPMVSGSAVVANQEIHPDILKQDRKIRGVDMETFAVFSACSTANAPKPIFMSVKAVSDFGEHTKGDKFQQYGAYISAASVLCFIQTFWTLHISKI